MISIDSSLWTPISFMIIKGGSSQHAHCALDNKLNVAVEAARAKHANFHYLESLRHFFVMKHFEFVAGANTLVASVDIWNNLALEI